jgi:Neutral/alkaline non-lysosomal ceramidase, N-terminal
VTQTAVQHEYQSLGQPEFRGGIGLARREMTPPSGMYTRSWGSSTHDIAEGVHQPLLATCIVFRDENGANELVLLAVDVMIFFQNEAQKLRGEILGRLGLEPQQLIVHPSHTHSMPMLLRKDVTKPGGELIGPYLDSLPDLFCRLIEEARAACAPATLGWKYGKCGLAFNRDSVDSASDRDICGLNLAVPADDTVLVGRITDDSGQVIGTLVNYACHPVSLGGANKLLSPDYIGTMRAVVESHLGGICVFMQGAAGDMTPRRSYEADVSAAEQNGRELGYAALTTLTGMFPPGHTLDYTGIEESGTPLGVWKAQRKPSISTAIAARTIAARLTVKDMPTRHELEEQLATRPSRFEVERLERALARRALVGDDREGELPFTIWRLGESFLVATPAEPYVDFQVQLRDACPGAAVAVMMASDGALNYLPTPDAYGRDVYQVRVALYETGALQTAIELTESTIEEMSA